MHVGRGEAVAWQRMLVEELASGADAAGHGTIHRAALGVVGGVLAGEELPALGRRLHAEERREPPGGR